MYIYRNLLWWNTYPRTYFSQEFRERKKLANKAIHTISRMNWVAWVLACKIGFVWYLERKWLNVARISVLQEIILMTFPWLKTFGKLLEFYNFVLCTQWGQNFIEAIFSIFNLSKNLLKLRNISFSNFSCMFLNPNIFFQFELYLF